MPHVPVRWKCSECTCINEKHPAFGYYITGKKRPVDPYEYIDEPGKWECTKCHHPSGNHRFTFEKASETSPVTLS